MESETWRKSGAGGRRRRGRVRRPEVWPGQPLGWSASAGGSAEACSMPAQGPDSAAASPPNGGGGLARGPYPKGLSGCPPVWAGAAVSCGLAAGVVLAASAPAACAWSAPGARPASEKSSSSQTDSLVSRLWNQGWPEMTSWKMSTQGGNPHAICAAVCWSCVLAWDPSARTPEAGAGWGGGGRCPPDRMEHRGSPYSPDA